MGEEVERLAEVEQLAAVLSGASAEYVHLAAPAHMEQARALLASPWLAARDAEVAERAKVEALREAADRILNWRFEDPDRAAVLEELLRLGNDLRACAGAAGDGEEGAGRGD